jgi:hypothetical protein
MHKEIFALAVRFPVVVADATIPQQPRPRRNQAVPANLVSVSMESHSGTGFFVAIKSL